MGGTELRCYSNGATAVVACIWASDLPVKFGGSLMRICDRTHLRKATLILTLRIDI